MADVSRETLQALELEPAVTRSIVTENLPVLRRFVTALAVHGEERGLIGPAELPRLWTRHILNCALIAPLLAPGRVGDVGTGAGLPGLVLAIIRPDVDFVLIEPMERRVTWLREQVAELQLHNVQVAHCRAEDYQPRHSLDQITARAVSALRTLIPITVPLLRPGGELLLMKGLTADTEIEAAHKMIRKHGLTAVRIIVLGEDVATEVTRVVRARVTSE